MNKAALSVKHLSKTYRRGELTTAALSDVSLDVFEGEFFGLLGPNGAGKSTLISALGSLIRPDAGTIEILGKDAAIDWRFCKMAVGIVPQEITVDPFFTVSEILHQQSGYYGLRHNEKWLSTLIEKLGLEDKAQARVSRLSGGMKRRVLIAQALVHKPPVIVLDEPTAGVDIELRHRIWDFMRELHAQGHTIILTTHYLEEAQALCRRIALLNNGKVAAVDETEALLKRFSGSRLQFRVIRGELPANTPYVFEHIKENLWCTSYADARALSDVLFTLQQAGLDMEIVHVGQPNLEEVFLRLTAQQPTRHASSATTLQRPRRFFHAL